MNKLFFSYICLGLLLTSTYGKSYNDWMSCSQKIWDVICGSYENPSDIFEECLEALQVINKNIQAMSRCSNFLEHYQQLLNNINEKGYFSQCFNSNDMAALVKSVSSDYYYQVFYYQYNSCAQD